VRRSLSRIVFYKLGYYETHKSRLRYEIKYGLCKFLQKNKKTLKNIKLVFF